MGAERDRIVSLQILRFVAAAMVVVAHASCAARSTAGPCALYYPTEMCVAGVDIFFVLSGFVICLTGPLASPRPAGATFFWKRFSRVAPLYYLLSMPFIARTLVHGGLTGPRTIATFLFWPAAGREIAVPYNLAGWTLCLEMVFYSAVSIALAGGRLRRNLLILGIGAVALIVARQFSDWTPLRFLTDPLFVEFGFGAALAWLWPHLRRSSVRLGLAMVALAVVAFVVEGVLGAGDTAAGQFLRGVMAGDDRFWRVAVFGVPAATLVAGAAICSRALSGRLVFGAAWLGDASYSTYLIQSAAVPMLMFIWFRIVGVGEPVAGTVVVMASTIAFGALTYVVIEKPILRDLRKLRPGMFRSRPEAALPT